MSTVFLAPWLQPETQSPQSTQARCSTPTWFGPSLNVTLIGTGKVPSLRMLRNTRTASP